MDELPTSFGKYYLTDKIATGGMAEIFLAKLIGPGGFEKPLVIKQIHPELSDQAQFVDLFVAEAKTLVSLSHGNIVPVYELGVIGETYFIAMEFIDGPSLREVQKALRRDSAHMAPALAASITAEVLKGLAYAHRKGVIHRDLSPRNVMLSREGEVKLVDFGIAVHEDQATSKDKLVGSYPYMSPEQVRGQPLTPASDLFSTGVLLWEMLTGQDLFVRDSAEHTLEAVTRADIPAPSTLRPGLARELDDMCTRALMREPEARYGAASDFLAELNRYLYARGQVVTSQSVSELVATSCPPEVGGASAQRIVSGWETDEDPTEPPEGDRTVPLVPPGLGDEDSEGAVPAETSLAPTRPLRTRPLPGRSGQGRRRAPTARTFATRRQFEQVLAKAAPVVPTAPISEEIPIPSRPGSDTGEARERVPVALSGPARGPRRWLPLAAVAMVLGLTAMLAVRSLGSTAVQSSDSLAMAEPDAGTLASTDPMPANVLSGASTPASALSSASPPASRAIPDAGRPLIAEAARDVAPAGAPARDPGSSPAHRARRPARPDAGPPPAPGTLKVGANPWGDVYADGRKLGRAPNAWPLAPGAHTIDVLFPVPGREQKKTFKVHIKSDAITTLGIIDFSASPLGP